ncbi:glutaredoxin-C8-like isoform X2 [Phoenix dactylifera]|uniref:Glutaredoxin-C8-like isoform X2 n=1 Tax=Phoenix dactylifera TaxID=42345 RepID=A0A8B7CLA7_PHODC|nr:glutaredoxin-C8-like isoform X2 [Phoenix dactylifera]
MYPAINRIPVPSCPFLQSKTFQLRGLSVYQIGTGASLTVCPSDRPRRRQLKISAGRRGGIPVSVPVASFLRGDRPTSLGVSSKMAAAEAVGKRGAAVMVALTAAAAAVAFFFGSAVKASTIEETFVKDTVSSHDIVIFSKSYCPYCRRAKAVFRELNKVPHVVELDQREDGSNIQDALAIIVGRRTVPQVFINGMHLGGSDDIVEAHENGRLAKLLGIDGSDDL